MKIKLMKTNPLNKIIVVGHPLSGYQEVEALLNISGMSPAKPSRREGFLPADISAILCKANQTPPFNALNTDIEIQQIDVGPIWNGMALDLLLGNIDQDFWGWADPQSVHLLDYWKAIDNQIAFVLVYDTPQQLLAKAFDGKTMLTPEALQQAIRNWSRFNAALLHFYHRNSERCLIVHAQQVRESANIYLQQVRSRIGAPVWVDNYPVQVIEKSNPCILSSHAQEPTQATLKAYLAHSLIQQQPEAMQLYEELQSAANLPLAEQIATSHAPLDAWLSMTAHQVYQEERFTQVQVETQTQAAKIQVVSHKIAGIEAQAVEKQKHIDCLEQFQATAQRTIEAQQQESELYILQLHQVQEELERRYLESQKQQEKIRTLLETQKLASEQRTQIEKLKQGKDAQIKIAAETVKRLEQLGQAKADQEKLAAKRKQQVEQLTRERDAQISLASETAKRLEQLGQAKAEQEKLVAKVKQQVEQLTKELTIQTKLIQEQAAKIKVIDVKPSIINLKQQENELLQRQLHQVQEELESYYLENQKLKQKSKIPVKPSKPVHYGAGERVKRQLSYRLGSSMVAQSQSFTGWLTMPWALLKQVREFHRDEEARGDVRLPPIKNYNDANEAEKVKQHLSYRLGSAMIVNARSPLGWLKMPWTLRHEVLTFKNSRSVHEATPY